jgi:hypothetical protein
MSVFNPAMDVGSRQIPRTLGPKANVHCWTRLLGFQAPAAQLPKIPVEWQACVTDLPTGSCRSQTS